MFFAIFCASGENTNSLKLGFFRAFRSLRAFRFLRYINWDQKEGKDKKTDMEQVLTTTMFGVEINSLQVQIFQSVMYLVILIFVFAGNAMIRIFTLPFVSGK